MQLNIYLLFYFYLSIVNGIMMSKSKSRYRQMNITVYMEGNLSNITIPESDVTVNSKSKKSIPCD